MYEDEHLLIVNKPTEVASIPSQYHKNGTMANYVKYYYNQQQYVNRIIHVVTRLDRDTTGLMMFAKHGFAHAMMDKQLQSGELKKYYHALVGGDLSRLKNMKPLICRLEEMRHLLLNVVSSKMVNVQLRNIN